LSRRQKKGDLYNAVLLRRTQIDADVVWRRDRRRCVFLQIRNGLIALREKLLDRVEEASRADGYVRRSDFAGVRYRKGDCKKRNQQATTLINGPNHKRSVSCSRVINRAEKRHKKERRGKTEAKG